MSRTSVDRRGRGNVLSEGAGAAGYGRRARAAARYAGPVIDVKVLRTDPDRVRASQRARGESVTLVDDLVVADHARRDAIAAYEELRAEQKELGKRLARADGAERTRLLARTKEL